MTTEKQKKIQLSKTHQHLGVKDTYSIRIKSNSPAGSKRKR
jgi:hypothetical protein